MKTFGVRICIVLCQFQRILAQMPHIDSQYNFRPVQMPNNMFRTSIVNDSLSSRIECATWCLLNAGYKNDCTAFYHKKGQNTRCECGDPYCYDKAKGMDISEIQPHINIKCKRPPLPPDGFNVGYSGGKSYKVVNEPPLNQTNAKLACEADNATLAMSKTDGDALDMMDLIGNVQDVKYWVGITTIRGSNDLSDLHFIDGSPYIPNNVNLKISIAYPDSACLFTYIYSADGIYYQSTKAVRCGNELPYICQWDPGC